MQSYNKNYDGFADV